jgi:predicted kinase
VEKDTLMNTRPTLHFLCGKLASGKTTLARRIAKENSAVLIIEDIWLNRLFPGQISDHMDYIEHSARFRAALQPHLLSLLHLGVSVVLDFAGNRPQERAWVRSVFEPENFAHQLHYIHATDRICKIHLKQRNLERPEGAKLITDQEFDEIKAYFVPPSPGEGFRLTEYLADRLRRRRLGLVRARHTYPSARWPKLASGGTPSKFGNSEGCVTLEEPAADAP